MPQSYCPDEKRPVKDGIKTARHVSAGKIEKKMDKSPLGTAESLKNSAVPKGLVPPVLLRFPALRAGLLSCRPSGTRSAAFPAKYYSGISRDGGAPGTKPRNFPEVRPAKARRIPARTDEILL